MSARIRPMTGADVPAVLAIERAVFTTPWSAESFLAEVAQPESREWVVAESGAGVEGYAGLMFVGDEAHVMNLAVDERARHAGLGVALVAHLLDAAAARGARRVTLEVRASNAAAIGLYRLAGLSSVGVRPGYYADVGEDASIMWTEDLDGELMRERRAALRERAERALELFRPPVHAAPDPIADAPDTDLILAIET
ncbi:MAG: ribosomal-protein-alanine N-acetyltransferase, partial [Actinobacteria bacterium]